ncbi:hypothetical protein [Shimia thalassica]|uniref:hypothetical protein n=1 Tax=Shimia thalassica TaxID=1715693 RepID=UPI0026E1E566|nr:hypothetical protein [Shimia thalassica]MDO6484484.1 hypothetical protein [Shimia thalassica]
MEQICILHVRETVCVNRSRLHQLTRQLGETDAKDILCRAVEEIATRLELGHALYKKDQHQEMRKCTRSLVAIADQIGMDTLTMVAEDVVTCIDASDVVALSATQSRLLRAGQRSLEEIWALQDISV